jgi:hypothetical protein
MKHIYIIPLALLLLSSCVKRSHIEFNGVTPGIKSGVFIVKTVADSTVYGVNIKGEKFTMEKRQLTTPGYYKMNVTDDNDQLKPEPFEVYLEDGTYTIQTEAGKLFKYPKITSPSKIQEQLSAFYTLSDKLSIDNEQASRKLREEVKNGTGLSKEAFNNLLGKLAEAEGKVRDNNVVVFKEFVKEYPNSEISAHLMEKINYEEDPASYYAIYKTLSPAAQNSDEGKEIGDKLSHLIKLVKGSKAPAIAGKTPDGKAFDPKSITAKVILVDFWRAGNEISRRNHDQIVQIMSEPQNKGKIGVLSISLDSKSDWWTTAIKDDHLSWPQVSDLKGDDSPNATNWNITQIPTYYLLDGNWNIIERNIDLNNVDFTVADYLKSH